MNTIVHGCRRIPSPAMVGLTASVIARDGLSEDSYRWMEGVFDDTPNDKVTEHVLDAFHGKEYGPGLRRRCQEMGKFTTVGKDAFQQRIQAPPGRTNCLQGTGKEVPEP